MKANKQKGFNTLALVVCAVVIVVVAGLVVWRVLDASKTSDTQTPDTTANQKQAEPQPETDPNEGYVVIKEWGVRFKAAEGLTGLQYFTPSDLTADYLTFTTTALANISANCSESSGDIILGLLSRNREQHPESGGVKAKIGDYVYQYRGPQAACSNGDLAMENKTLTALLKSLESLEAAQ